MIAMLLILFVAVVCLVLVAAVFYTLDLRDELAASELACEEALCWSDEYQRQALLAQAELAEAKQNYLRNWDHAKHNEQADTA